MEEKEKVSIARVYYEYILACFAWLFLLCVNIYFLYVGIKNKQFLTDMGDAQIINVFIYIGGVLVFSFFLYMTIAIAIKNIKRLKKNEGIQTIQNQE